MKEPTRSVRRRSARVVTYFKHPYVSAIPKGADGVVRSVKKRACGFRSMDYFTTVTYLIYGKLGLRAVTTFFSVRVLYKLAHTRISSQLAQPRLY